MQVRKSIHGSGLLSRKRVQRQIVEDKLLNKLESGWHNAYEPNLGSFSDQQMVVHDREKQKSLSKSMIRLKALRQIDSFRKYGHSQLSQKLYHLERMQRSPGHKVSEDMVKFY